MPKIGEIANVCKAARAIALWLESIRSQKSAEPFHSCHTDRGRTWSDIEQAARDGRAVAKDLVDYLDEIGALVDELEEEERSAFNWSILPEEANDEGKKSEANQV